jgi:23S rRNA (guanine745-N1)-methyltransferase
MQRFIVYFMDSLISFLACPICGAQFILQQTALVCAHAHAFDIAREGYVNLLRKKLPGDTKEMLLARRSFFDQGYYQPVSDTINTLVETYAPTGSPLESMHILDAGCGEGYYLGRLHTYLTAHESYMSQASHSSHGQQPLCLGVDISKEGIRLAAKRYREDHFLVANLKERLVFIDETIQVMLNIFAPRNTEEYTRVLAPGALLLVVIPGSSHLHQLRASLHLLNIEEHKQQNVVEQFSPHFLLLTTRTITYTLCLRQPDITWLVMMTPNYWHLSAESRTALEQLDEREVTVEVTFLVLRRQSD